MTDDRPLAIDLFCGIAGWSKGLIAAGFRVVGFDLEDMFKVVGEEKPEHFSLVIQDVMTLHGAQFKDAALIVGSSPCQKYSWMAMPWRKARAEAERIRADETGEERAKLNALFDAQFRIQREASEAAGHHIPMVVENVRGAAPWVGAPHWKFGSYALWGDIPALMPQAIDAKKVPGFRFDGSGGSFQTASVQHHELGGRKSTGGSWFKIGGPGQAVTNNNPDGRQWTRDPMASTSSGSSKRKAASAKVAEIPFALSSHIGRVYYPR